MHAYVPGIVITIDFFYGMNTVLQYSTSKMAGAENGRFQMQFEYIGCKLRIVHEFC
jgi:hypothetical protein